MKLRPAQIDILKYEHGRIAVSAVPGSGKTFTLSLLAATLLKKGLIDVDAGQQILIVTYLNSSVDTFRTRIRSQLSEIGLPPRGFEVRTLHSLALEVVNTVETGITADGQTPSVIDETQSHIFLVRAVSSWLESNRNIWGWLDASNNVHKRIRIQNIIERTARSFTQTAKNNRYLPVDIYEKLESKLTDSTSSSDSDLKYSSEAENSLSLLWMLAGVYKSYSKILSRQAALDFDDLIWLAVETLEQRIDIRQAMRLRWAYILEDEAQDSVPLQEQLLDNLSGPKGNWVRVGDPNQAITSTFTAAHPMHFVKYISLSEVKNFPLPNSGRSAKLIQNAANALVHWSIHQHPVHEVRSQAFREQYILPTPPGDSQPNPSDDKARIVLRVYSHREEEELPTIARIAHQYTKSNSQQTLAILVPTNAVGRRVAEQLDFLEADYDDLLRGGSKEREIATSIQALLTILTMPLSTKALVNAYSMLSEIEHTSAALPDDRINHFHTLLRSLLRPEILLFPSHLDQLEDALPAGILDKDDIQHLERFASYLRHLFSLRSLPIDDMILTICDELYGSFLEDDTRYGESDLAIGYQIAHTLRGWHDLHPDWRLPELTVQLADVAEGRRRLAFSRPNDIGFEPTPSRITLATQHGAKGMEWDAVFLVGIDGFWIPGNLDAPFLGVQEIFGGDPTAESVAQLNYLMRGKSGLFPGRTATESAHIEVICERLRLFYVGITRARIFLHISRSRKMRSYNKDQDTEPATALGLIYNYLSERVQN
jgi:DNA helicase-2/ATP-dependent DNA helicase PcrA